MVAMGILMLFQLPPQSAISQESQKPEASAATNEELPADLLQITNTEAFSKYVLLVDKNARKLVVFERNGESIRKIQEIAADIGKSTGNKTQRDDHKTPEGIYFFQQKRSPPEIPFSLYGKMAFTTDYPNLFDRRAKKTGSGIWLHSIPEDVPLTRGSRGCVVIRNSDLEKLSGFIKLKETPLIIYDQIKYLSKAEHDGKRKEITDYLETWRQAWQGGEINTYISFYDETFNAPAFKSLRAWRDHKQRLKDRREKISVQLFQPFVLLHNNNMIVKVLQKYESSEHTDYGIKMLFADKGTDGKFKIIREEWTPANEKGQELSALNQEKR